MANKYLNLAGLQKYDELIKQYIGTADAKAIKYGKIENGILKLYKAENPAEGATPDFALTLPTQDLSGFAHKVGSATSGNLAALDANGDLVDAGAALSSLETKAHAGEIPVGAIATDITGYAAEVADAAQSAAETNSAVTIAQNGLTYTIYQGGNQATDIIGTINIPADMVVTAGVVETYDAQHLPSGVTVPGTYIKLTIANATNDYIYINVEDLCDVYTAEQSAAQVQVAINQNRVVSATIVAGSIGATELGTDAVETAKIKDKNVTKAKLADAVQASLDLADTAVQPGDFEPATTAEIEALFA